MQNSWATALKPTLVMTVPVSATSPSADIVPQLCELARTIRFAIVSITLSDRALDKAWLADMNEIMPLVPNADVLNTALAAPLGYTR